MQNYSSSTASLPSPPGKRRAASLLSSAATAMAISRPRSRAFPLLLPLFLLVLLASLIYSVSRLRLSWAPEQYLNQPPPAAPKRPDRLVLGPAAGQGRPDRLQFQGLKAVNKISSSSERLYSGEHVSFVTVFTTYNSDPAGAGKMSSEIVTVGKHSYSKVERSMAVLNTFVSFIQVSMPRSNLIILTDPRSKLSINQGSAVVLPIEGNYSRGNLMLQRVKSYIAFLELKLVELERAGGFNHFIFTDSDIAVVEDLGHIFKRYPHCHLALTFRNNKGQPLNSGFVAVRGTNDGISKAIEFFKEVLEAYNLKYMKASRMLGDQLALAWVVKSHLPSAFGKFSRHEAFTGEVSGASILFLPCAVYNWTPPEGAGQFHGMPLDVKLILTELHMDPFDIGFNSAVLSHCKNPDGAYNEKSMIQNAVRVCSATCRCDEIGVKNPLTSSTIHDTR